ncbi:alpha/beta hydrolase [Sphaerimonospora thailandensis]|uniref:Lipase n=1 Tax=Sphaerimonospora thailandensis TaxID=795644 RepID=A0A8J3R8E6_9ACTN|nr:alpha/beta fold hydrolase [Sphaerimonospora thailandensis]GIH71246.1 lipase [Sphaerimonospora thailandensis]
MSTTRLAWMSRAIAVTGTVALLTAGGITTAQAGSAEGNGTGHAIGNSSHQSVPPGQRGRLLRSTKLTGATVLPSAASNRLVRYVSVGARGRRIEVTGAVAIPRGKAPAGGWPVISWAHGTVGNADRCTPTRQDGGYIGTASQTLDRYVAAGYAVVQTDYEGLGTPGVHPYLNGPSAANTVVDIVRAARALDPRVGKNYVVMGHSQGGHSALWTAAQSDPRRDVRLLGAVAISPGGHNLKVTTSYFSAIPHMPRAQAIAVLAFLPTILSGAEAADPAIDAAAMLIPEAQPLLEVGRNGCIEDSYAVAEQVYAAAPRNPFADGTETEQAKLTAYLDSQASEHLRLRVPTMVVSSWGDTLVDPATQVNPLIPRLCANSRPLVDYLLLGSPPATGPDHRTTVAASYGEARAFADAVFARRTPATHQAC